MIKIFVAGDIVPNIATSQNISDVKEGIFDDVKSLIAESDIAIANLEAPVIMGTQTPIKKSGPCLFTKSNTIEVLKNIGFNVISLANNHFFDQGQAGVNDTLKVCRHNNIETVGGGEKEMDARRILYKKIKGKHIAIINACENEFSIADNDHGGSNPLDLINMHEDIVRAKEEADYVILIIHGGIEYYQYPTPRMKRWYHHFVDLGADVVLNHHQHCISGYEVYKGKPIFYGLGNFYFPPFAGLVKPKCWDYGYAVQLMIGDKIEFDMIPYVQNTYGIRLRNKEEFDQDIKFLNLTINDDNRLQQEFENHILEKENEIKQSLLPSFMHNRFLSALARRGYLGRLYMNKQVLTLKNKLICESHYEKLKGLFTLITKH